MLKREFKINLKSLLIWTSIIVFLLLFVFIIYPYIVTEDNMKALDEIMSSMSKDVLSIFNMDKFSISTVYGWIKTEGYMFITLLGGIYSALLGSSILSIEEKDKTIEYLISKPITRNKIISNKLICGFINILVLTIIIFICNLIGLACSHELVIKELLLISFSPLMLYYSLFSISLLISTIIKNPKKTTFVGLVITFIAYALSIIGSISDKVSLIKKISLFEAVNINYLLSNMHINYIYLIVTLFIVFIYLFTTYKVYNNKELV